MVKVSCEFYLGNVFFSQDFQSIGLSWKYCRYEKIDGGSAKSELATILRASRVLRVPITDWAKVLLFYLFILNVCE